MAPASAETAEPSVTPADARRKRPVGYSSNAGNQNLVDASK
ncbi:MAG: hypothetical protein ACRYG7_41735 [Janthinobacterium lividum]